MRYVVGNVASGYNALHQVCADTCADPRAASEVTGSEVRTSIHLYSLACHLFEGDHVEV